MSGQFTTTAGASRTKPKLQFTQKQINVTFTVASGGSLGPNGNADQVTLSGYRCQVEVTGAGMINGAALSLRITNLPMAMMNRLSVLTLLVDPNNTTLVTASQNTVEITAGDAASGMTSIFYGYIAEAFADFAGAPNAAFQVVAYDSLAARMKTLAARGWNGPVSVSEVLSDIALRAGWNFDNRGVTGTLPSYYGYGSAASQVDRLARQVPFAYTLRGGSSGTNSAGATDNAANANQTLVVFNKDIYKNSYPNPPLVNRASGLIGWPAYSQRGVTFSTIFNPLIAYRDPIRLVSEYLPQGWVHNAGGQVSPMPSDGHWLPIYISHELDSELPNGRWFTRVEAVRADFGTSLLGASP